MVIKLEKIVKKYNINTIKLDKNLRYFRRLKGYTQEKLEDLSGVCTRHISEIENGDVNCKISTLFSLANALGLTIYDLLEFDLENHKQKIFDDKKKHH